MILTETASTFCWWCCST